jgi:hypothetical protein
VLALGLRELIPKESGVDLCGAPALQKPAREVIPHVFDQIQKFGVNGWKLAIQCRQHSAEEGTGSRRIEFENKALDLFKIQKTVGLLQLATQLPFGSFAGFPYRRWSKSSLIQESKVSHCFVVLRIAPTVCTMSHR